MLAKKLYEGDHTIVGAWNFGPDDESFIPVRDVVKRGIEHLGLGSYRVVRDVSKHESQILKLDITKAKSLLGWRPRFLIDDNIRFTFEWYKEYYAGTGDIKKFTAAQIDYFFNL